VITHLLDTSAWLAHLLRESGHEQVSSLLLEADNRVGVSALSLVEVHARMRHLKIEERFVEIVEEYRELFAQFLPVDDKGALRATTLRQESATRVPAIDSLIAATAAHHGAILVHRDPHFLALAGEEVKQHLLAAEE
jgi:predicted nucleic acid-binding protein